MSRLPAQATSPPLHNAAVEFEYDSTDADDDFQLIAPNTASTLHSSPLPTSPSPSIPPPPSTASPSIAILPIPASSAATRSPSARRRRRKAATGAAPSTSSLDADEAANPSSAAGGDPSWGVKSHFAGYRDSDWAVQPHRSGGSPPDPSLHQHMNPPPASMEYEETEETEEERGGLDGDGDDEESSTQLGFAHVEDEAHHGRGKEGKDEGAPTQRSAAQSSAPSASTLYSSIAAFTAAFPSAVSGSDGLPRALPLYSGPSVLSYSPTQHAAAVPAPSDVPASSTESSASSSSSAVPPAESPFPAPSKPSAETDPLPYFPWVSQQFLTSAGYVAVSALILLGLRLGYLYYSKGVPFQMPS